jgi:hypothetical protein
MVVFVSPPESLPPSIAHGTHELLPVLQQSPGPVQEPLQHTSPASDPHSSQMPALQARFTCRQAGPGELVQHACPIVPHATHVPASLQTSLPEQPQGIVPPQPSLTRPQTLPSAAQVLGMQPQMF